MSTIYDKYEVVIGLEVHAQLNTQTKIFAADEASFGAAPNTHISAITLGLPGVLPKFNGAVLEKAIRLGLALNCNITPENHFARKNYFYADLPKGYQITQDKTPICTGGHVDIKLKDGSEKRINLTRIHMEEDAGKSLHDIDPFETLIDLNRAGTPLLGIVTEPDFTCSDEAYVYLTEVKKLVRYLDICDGNMEEGSLRCDANVSVMLKDAKEYGKKVEVKNMNSFRNVQRAIDFEIKRQIDLLESGGDIAGETRSFNATDGSTFALRSKENANDYRYFPEPDLQPVFITQEYINTVKAHMPELPNDLLKKFTKEFGLSEYDALNLTDLKGLALYFNELVTYTKNYKAAANWMMGSIKSYLNENAIAIEQFHVTPKTIADLIALIDEGKISNATATQKLFPELMLNPTEAPLSIAQRLDIIQSNDTGALQELVDQALAKYPEKITEYKNGKTNLLGLFVGEVMKMGKGKADPKMANQLVKEALEK
jgi:aspartyl-tRNA(Asn)/glutamyl-tRNA(Gln) amidotransferase subunit B